MKHPITQALQKSLSRALPNSTARTIVQLALLVTVGVLAMVLHAKLRIPMHLPGKQGLLYMFLVMSACLITDLRYSAIVAAAASAGLLLAGFGSFDDPFMPLYYIVLGIILDILLNARMRSSGSIYYISLAGGIAFMSIPLMRAVVSIFTGFPYGSLMQGVFYPASTHFLFGFAGSLLAVLAAKQLPEE